MAPEHPVFPYYKVLLKLIVSGRLFFIASKFPYYKVLLKLVGLVIPRPFSFSFPYYKVLLKHGRMNVERTKENHFHTIKFF